MTPDDQASTIVYALGRVLEGGPLGGMSPRKLTTHLTTAGSNVGGQLDGSGRHRLAELSP